MSKELVKPVRILTEEELRFRESVFQDQYMGSIMSKKPYQYSEEIISSHRELMAANAELSFKNQNNKILLEKALGFIEAIVGFTGQNLEVFNWHQNGDGEPFDNFIDENLDATLFDELKSALEGIK